MKAWTKVAVEEEERDMSKKCHYKKHSHTFLILNVSSYLGLELLQMSPFKTNKI